MISRRDLLIGLLGASVASRAAAQTTSRTARMLVGFPPGGSIDLVARALVEHVKVPVATAMIVDNRPGAGGRLALEAIRSAPADGATIGLTPGDQLTLFPSVYKKLGYDPLRDFAAISTICTLPFVLAVGPLVPVEVANLGGFIEWCRAHPKQSNFGSPGAGSRPHFMGMALAREASIELTHLPYKGGVAALQDLLSGQIAAAVTALSNALPHVQSGRLRALLISAPHRIPLVPAVPTAREAEFPVFEGEEWLGVFAPASTPPDIIDAWNGAIRHALAAESMDALLRRQAFQPTASTPQDLMKFLRSDIERWRREVSKVRFAPID